MIVMVVVIVVVRGGDSDGGSTLVVVVVMVVVLVSVFPCCIISFLPSSSFLHLPSFLILLSRSTTSVYPTTSLTWKTAQTRLVKEGKGEGMVVQGRMIKEGW